MKKSKEPINHKFFILPRDISPNQHTAKSRSLECSGGIFLAHALCSLRSGCDSSSLPLLHQRHSFFTAQEIEIHARGDWITNFLLKSVFHSAPTFTGHKSKQESKHTDVQNKAHRERARGIECGVIAN
jgi:hypothetical protein